ncbi:uncharacterized protein LOC106060612 isoform X4 [Biomphalaria glabrata]|nr:uncharacterized protein LOC106060612 isoform X4 [Biomphalaria glabrata]XP_055895091.1 uncharacterized protein LOC106060612 isoform X4 [Biomphalaria glabrata]
MDNDHYRGDSEVEADSDHEDGGYHFHTDLDSHDTGTVRRRAKTIVTPKMAMESFRLSFLNDDQDVNFDAILGELYELESQLSNTQSELSRSLGTHLPPPAPFQDGKECSEAHGQHQTAHISEQEELDLLAAEITRGLHYHKTNGHHHPHHHHHHHHQHHHQVDSLCDTLDTDSAFSDNASLPSSESFTSMATVSSSADTTSSSSGDTCSMTSAICAVNHAEEEQIARLKAEKIRIALEKIREAKIRKLFVRAFAKDGSSKSILVDEKMSVAQVCSQLADKNHIRLNHKMSVVEHMPELLMERILEDHDSLVENMVMWTRDSKNKVVFEERMDKYDLFRNPEKYLLGCTSSKPSSLVPAQKDKLIQEFFSPDSVCVPSMEGLLFLKSDGKKAWKKFFFVLRASGLYYNPKGKTSKNPKDLLCLVQFDYVEVYRGLGWKKKYHAPTDFCFALKHPQIQKKTSKYIRYFCAESETTLDQWVMGVRIVKLGKQMLHNYERLTHEISMWDLREPEASGSTVDEATCQMLNHDDLNDSRMSVPEPGSRHSVIQVHNNNSSSTCDTRDVMNIEVLAIPPRKASESGSGGGSDGRSLNGSILSDSSHKTPVKRVSFSATHSIITGEHVEVKHRDSIISASTDSSEDSNSSGEIRPGSSFRGKLRPRLPVTTETTRQLADMCNVSMDENDEAVYAESQHRGTSSAFARSERRRSSMHERRGSSGSTGSDGQKVAYTKHSHLSSSLKQQSQEVYGAVSCPAPLEIRYQHSPVDSPYQGSIRRKSEPTVVPEESPGSPYPMLYSPVREEQDCELSCDQEQVEPFYNQIRNPPANRVSIPPPAQFREEEVAHLSSSYQPSHDVFTSMQTPLVHTGEVRTSSHSSHDPAQAKSLPPATLPKPQSNALTSTPPASSRSFNDSPSIQLTTKLPPPTLPKTSQTKSAMNSKLPPPCVEPGNNELQVTPISEDRATCPSQSPSLPFLSELSKKTSSEPGGDSSNNSSTHRRCASASGPLGRGDKKVAPPPPPKRSESTRLSVEVSKVQQPLEETVQNGVLVHEPIYENFDGILDIDELPPPPPELLMDLPQPDCPANSGSIKKCKPPPPPPKRSKDTQLSGH